MGIVKFVLLSLLAHVLLIGGLWAHDRFYLQPRLQKEEQARKAEQEQEKQQQEQKQKLIQAGTAKVVSPEEAQPASTESEDPMKPSGKPEDYKGFRKPGDSRPPALPGEENLNLDAK